MEQDQLKEMIEQAMEQLQPVLEMAEKTAPKIAKIYRIMYESLRDEGFTSDQAMDIVSRFNPTPK